MTMRIPMIRLGLFLALFLALPLAGQARLHYTLLESPPRPLPSRLLVLPAHVRVSQLFAGGVTETVPAWSAAASDNLCQAVRENLARRSGLELVELPPLQSEQQAAVDEHLAVFEQVGMDAWMLTFGSDRAWEHKRRHFDYTLGPQLAFLKERTGAEAAVLIVGEDTESTGGRKATVFFAAMLGVGIPMGRSFIALSVVDLETGDLLWMYYTTSPSKNLKDKAQAKGMVDEILKAYPGLPAHP